MKPFMVYFGLFFFVLSAFLLFYANRNFNHVSQDETYTIHARNAARKRVIYCMIGGAASILILILAGVFYALNL